MPHWQQIHETWLFWRALYAIVKKTWVISTRYDGVSRSCGYSMNRSDKTRHLVELELLIDQPNTRDVMSQNGEWLVIPKNDIRVDVHYRLGRLQGNSELKKSDRNVHSLPGMYYSHVSLIWCSLIRLLNDLHVLCGNHLNTMYNKVSC